MINTKFNFESLVNKDIKTQVTTSELEILAQNLDKWLLCLYSIKRDVEYNLSSRQAGKKISIRQMKASNASIEDINKVLASEGLWRVNTLKFLNSLEKKILYVKLAIKEAINESTDQDL